MTPYIIMILVTFLGAGGSLYLKRASGSQGVFSLIKNYNFYIGGGLYFSSAVLNIVVLKYLDYSVVLPMTSLTYIWTLFLSAKILGESITKKKIVGVFLIALGSLIVSIA